MIVKRMRIEVSSPFFYYTYGGTFADTGPFLGDVALMYALAYSLGLLPYPMDDKREQDIRTLPFLVTVGRPETLRMKSVMAVSSSFENSLAAYKEVFLREGGSIPYKNVRRIRAVDVGSEFVAYYFSKDLDLPWESFGLRVGVQRDGVLAAWVEEPKDGDEVWLNSFTLKAKGLNYDPITRVIRQIDAYNQTYVILKGPKLRDVKKFIEAALNAN